MFATASAVLIANRGEIARRIVRTARRMGLGTVAVYSDADADAPHVREADSAVRIGAAPASSSYLDRDAIVEAARRTGATLVHPGYGFLAEDAGFAQACLDAELVFVGPSPEVLRRMGDKAAAKRAAAEAGTPVLPGYAGEQQDDAALARAADAIGYPVLVKPAAGGGGKGMAVIHGPEDLAGALASARRIASSAFGDDRLLLERYLLEPRHVEVQIMADAHGSVLHLGERDCSLQRRHQKVMEEAPAPGLDRSIRSRLHEGAVALAEAVGYTGAGTCEFLVGADGAVGFIEMNARLQVEHPVTELVCGLDLVELQLRVAMGERLPIAQADVAFEGHAVEVRVYAEAPDEGYLPQAGTLHHVRWPEAIRVDAGVEEGDEVPRHYDPMLAKLVAHGPDRDVALERLRQGLDSTEVLGVGTNVTFLRAVLSDPVVASGRVTTGWLEPAYAGWEEPRRGGVHPAALQAAAAAELDRAPASSDPWASLGPWRVGGGGTARVTFHDEGDDVVVDVAGTGPWAVRGAEVERLDDEHGWQVGSERVALIELPDRWLAWVEGAAYEIARGPAPRSVDEAASAHLGAPMPGQVVAIRVAAGDEVTRGQELVVVEAMKMEHAVKAPADGVVTAVLCATGDQVDRGQPLVDLEPARD